MSAPSRPLACEDELEVPARQPGDGLEQTEQPLAVAEPADIEDLRLTAGHGCEAEELGVDPVRHHLHVPGRHAVGLGQLVADTARDGDDPVGMAQVPVLEAAAEQAGVELEHDGREPAFVDGRRIGEHRAVEGHHQRCPGRQRRQQRQVDVEQVGAVGAGSEPAAEHSAVGEVTQRRQRVVRALDQADAVDPALAAGQPVPAREDGDLMAAPRQASAGLQHMTGHAFARWQSVVGEKRQPHQAADPRTASRGARATAVLQK